MKAIYTVLIGALILQSSDSFSMENLNDSVEVECEFRIERTQRPEGQRDFIMRGSLRLKDITEEKSYLTLEPPSSIDVPITARVLLTRYSVDYFPMTLHPRGDTVHHVAHTTLEGKKSEALQFSEGGINYSLICNVLEQKEH